MMLRLSFLLLALLCTPMLFSQRFEGKVITSDGAPIPYVSFYLKELQSGFITDDKGCYQTTLPVGSYTCHISCLGYVQKSMEVTVPPEGIKMEIILSERVYQLGEVSVVRGNENPAYSVMRQAISQAPYFRNHVKQYKAETYLKGSGKLKSIPAIMKLSGEVREESKKYLDKLFLIEEQRKVSFTAPDKWDNEVLAYSNSFPEKIMIEIESTNINLYQPTLFGMVSPLNSKAFSYYNFKLESCYPEGEYLINKIKIIPKKDNPELLSGYIYVVENLWCISAVEVTSNQGMTKAQVKVTCHEVKPAVFLPTSISMDMFISAMGIKADASYLSAIRYTEIELTHTASTLSQQTETGQLPTKTPTKQEKKLQAKINQLTEKEELSNRDAYKLAKLHAQIIELQDTTRNAHKYERQHRTSNNKTDSLADKRDSVYWATVRSVPLRKEELESYAYKEILINPEEAKKDSTSKRDMLLNKIMGTMMVGRTIPTRDKKAWIQLYGLTSYLPGYNFVDGFWIGGRITGGVKLNNTSTLTFTPEAYYTTAREKLIAKGNISLKYAPRRRGELSVSGGRSSADYNGESAESSRINTYSTLLFGRNDVKYYERKYLDIHHQIELANSLLFTAGFVWEQREMLNNHVSKSLFGKKASPNTPDNANFDGMPRNEFMKSYFSLAYTPAHYYRMIRGKKVYEESAHPTFTLTYQRAFPYKKNGVSTASYHRAELSAQQALSFGLFNTLAWQINTGTYWKKSNTLLPDYKHFATTSLPVTERSFNQGFALLDNYICSTNGHWAQINTAWYTPYMLIKHLPFLRKKLFNEGLHLRSLLTDRYKPYLEVGYSVGLSDMMRAGVFVGFDRWNHHSTGISISLPLRTFMPTD